MNIPAKEAPIRTPRFWPMSEMSNVMRLARIKKKTPMGASLMRNSITMYTIRSTSRMARRREEFGPLRRQPRITAETRTARSWSSARAWKIYIYMCQYMRVVLEC